MLDGRLHNYAGACRYGYGTCFQQVDTKEFPFGRGAGLRALIPFKSVAVDPTLIQLGEPLYLPELDGVLLPDGSIHDGCVRADDVGGAIKKRHMDFFAVTYGNHRPLIDQLLGASAGSRRTSRRRAASTCAFRDASARARRPYSGPRRSRRSRRRWRPRRC